MPYIWDDFFKEGKGERVVFFASRGLEIDGGGLEIADERSLFDVWKIDGEVDDILQRVSRDMRGKAERTFSSSEAEERWAQRISG